ncbi:DUF1028 domain-containing protein [Saccharopolyspora shandongensis]|uniref:DUF1028 domain-containing protein n=1 Tax=Saccharopolyspora shandongensis TaxID=418495 RepID=UPI00343474EE
MVLGDGVAGVTHEQRVAVTVIRSSVSRCEPSTQQGCAVHVGTSSIAAYDVVAGCAGVAASTRMPSIGALSVFARAASGAIATQALINPLLGIDGLELLRMHSADETLRRLLASEPGSESRQVAIVDKYGRSAAHTGPETHPWSGRRAAPGYAVAGNMLVDMRTVDAASARCPPWPATASCRR